MLCLSNRLQGAAPVTLTDNHTLPWLSRQASLSEQLSMPHAGAVLRGISKGEKPDQLLGGNVVRELLSLNHVSATMVDCAGLLLADQQP